MRIDLGKISVTPKGAYNSTTIYERLDIVSDNGNSYLSRIDKNNKSLTDTASWQLLVEGSSIEELSDADIKEKYESNPDTNAFTDADKLKLASLENFDDSVIQTELDTKVDKVAGKSLSTNDFTDADKLKLASLENFDDSAIQTELDTKVDKVAGFGLSKNNFSDADKTKLENLQNFDPSGIIQDLGNKVDKIAGKGLSDNNYSTADKTKLDNINLSNYVLQTSLNSQLTSYVLQSNLNTLLQSYATLNGVQTYSGTKTFTEAPIVPTATLNGHAVNLGQLANANVLSATRWQTARTFTIGNSGKSVNGSANTSWTLAEIGAVADADMMPASRTLSFSTSSSINKYNAIFNEYVNVALNGQGINKTFLPIIEVSDDGATWTNLNLTDTLKYFNAGAVTGLNIPNNFFRFTFRTNDNYNGYFYIGFRTVTLSPGSLVSGKYEHSTDGNTWVENTFGSNSDQVNNFYNSTYFSVQNPSRQYHRLTVQKHSGQNIQLAQIMFLSNLPYDVDRFTVAKSDFDNYFLKTGGVISGNVGIGKTPTEKLDVDGRVRAKAYVFDVNSETLPNQIVTDGTRFSGTSSVGTKRGLMYNDYADLLALSNGMTDAQKTEWKTAMNGGWTTNTMSVGLISPPKVDSTLNSPTWFLLQGANLNLNPNSFAVDIVNLSGNVIVAVPGSQVSLSTTDGTKLRFYANLNALTNGNYKIRLWNGVAYYTTSKTFSVSDTLTHINLSSLAWSKKTYNDNPSSIINASGGSAVLKPDAAVKALADDGVLISSLMSSQFIAAGEDFYIKYTTQALGTVNPSKTTTAKTHISLIPTGTTNDLIPKGICKITHDIQSTYSNASYQFKQVITSFNGVIFIPNNVTVGQDALLEVIIQRVGALYTINITNVANGSTWAFDYIGASEALCLLVQGTNRSMTYENNINFLEAIKLN